jgi:hypothetical protein
MHDRGEITTALDASDPDAFLLARLARFSALAADPRVRRVPAQRRLAEHAAEAAFADCAARGRAVEALAILKAALWDQPQPA